jgi:hypothetical protein
VGRVVPVARNHLKFFGILMNPNYDVLRSLGIFRQFLHIIELFDDLVNNKY